MVIAPVATTFEIALPLKLPKNPLAITATLAGPPLNLPRRHRARLRKNLPAPEAISIPAKRRKPIRISPITCAGSPSAPLVLKAKLPTVQGKSKLIPHNIPGI
ncbi:hypothetical protein ES703_123408 [subsurface metagenome]